MTSVGKTLSYRSALIGLLGLFAFACYELSAVVPKANAIPAFARKYNFACNVCHVPGFPKLNDFGNLFRDQGYQLGTDGDLPTAEGITMGFWPVSMRTTNGMAIRISTDVISNGSRKSVNSIAPTACVSPICATRSGVYGPVAVGSSERPRTTASSTTRTAAPRTSSGRRERGSSDGTIGDAGRIGGGLWFVA